ncbi:MAG: hypothetical protein IJW86_07320 [Clostridia bacterium]|nr:hypothetical protein [Clostridia bacterium]
MSFNELMRTEDASLSKFATVYMTTAEGNRLKMLMCKNFEAKANVKTKALPRMGAIVEAYRATGVALPFKMTIYKCTEEFDKMVDNFIKKGIMPKFQIQCSNEDPTTVTTIGRSDKIYNSCILDGDVLLSLAGSEEDYIEQEINGYAEGVETPERYRNPEYM